MKMLRTMSDQISIVKMALSTVAATETCSKTECAEERFLSMEELSELSTEELLITEMTPVELSTVFRQNPGLLTPHNDQSL